MEEFVLAKETCTRCKEEKVKVVYFPPKGKVCRACKTEISRAWQKSLGTDTKKGWKHVGFHLNGTF